MAIDTLYLVRHGEAAASWGESRDPGLSTLGHQQALDASLELQDLLGEAKPTLLSSPLLRAQETATPLAEALKLPVAIHDAFAEIPSPVPLAERQNWLRAFMRSTWSQGDEALHAWRSRMLEAVQALPANSVVFSHFLVINTIVGHTQGADKTLVCWPDNAAIVVLERSADVLRVRSLGRQMETFVN